MWRPGQVVKKTAVAHAPTAKGPTAADVRAAASGRLFARPDVVVYVLWVIVLALCVQRCIYHLAYLRNDPFALITIADGQVYEDAARDILAFPWWGSKPFYLQGAYAYLLAAGILPNGDVVGGLILQLTAASAGLVLFGLAARACFGPRAGLLSLIVLLASPDVTFYENKYLSVVLASFACMLLLWTFARTMHRPNLLHACLVGLSAGLCALSRPNLILVAPFCAFGVWLVAQRRSQLVRTLLLISMLVGLAGALTPMALRNWVVTGRPTVFPSHGGGIPFFIGNNPQSNGRWNDAGGLLGRQVSLERDELAAKLGIHAQGADLDAAIGGELYRRAFDFIRTHPGSYALLELRKLWALTGNHAYTHDYDLLGERDLLGAAFPLGLPFGIVLGLGTLGLSLLYRRARSARHEPAHSAVFSVSCGLVFATLVANLLWFTAAQHRVPLYLPLAFAAGPALDAIARRLRRELPASGLPIPALVVAALLCAQAFYPRVASSKPSSTHYFNLANVEEELGRPEDALAHYALATERNPKVVAYWWRRAVLAQRLRRNDDARYSLDQLIALPDLSPELKDATRAARMTLH
jgi:4-amino-4-deoxy-L-arabinose transferase-like glycosyltransferase